MGRRRGADGSDRRRSSGTVGEELRVNSKGRTQAHGQQHGDTRGMLRE